MSAPLIVSAELVALERRKLERADPMRERRAADFESGVAITKPARSAEPQQRLRGKGRYRPESPEGAARRARRRALGGSGVMPHRLRSLFTEGERAALCVVAGEVQQMGRCKLPIGAIAARAGVSRTTVQNAVRRAVALKLVSVRQRRVDRLRNLPNTIEVISTEWQMWIDRGPWRQWGIGYKFAKILYPTKSRTQQTHREERVPWKREGQVIPWIAELARQQGLPMRK